MSKVIKAISHLVSSRLFFLSTLFIMGIQSVWVAFSAIYPLPFDEYYHVGLIKIYAQQWLPFIGSQPPEASLYGDITRASSYLYHYVMSFPYRLLDIFIASEEVKIIILRLLNIAFVLLAIAIFRKLFINAGISKKVINIAVLFLVLTPMVPFLSAHVNYDNLLILLTSLLFLFAFKVIKAKDHIARDLLILLAVGSLGALVKYTFLLIFTPLLLYIAVTIVNNSRGWSVLKKVSTSFNGEKLIVRAMLTVICILGIVLFSERIGANVIKYHEPEPNCELVQPTDVCKNFMPWYRNSQAKLELSYKEKEFGNSLSYTQHWATKMMRGYFAIFSHTPTRVVSNLELFGPIVIRPLMPIPIVVAYTALLSGVVLAIANFKKLWKNKYIKPTIIVCATYVVSLWLFNYSSYSKIGAAYAIQARYLFPILLPMFAIFLQAWDYTKISKSYKTALLVLAIVVYSWGGGVLGWIIRSDNLWYWQNPTIITVNKQAQKILKYVVPH